MSSFRPQSSRELSPSLHIIYIFDLKVSEDVKKKSVTVANKNSAKFLLLFLMEFFFKRKNRKKENIISQSFKKSYSV